MKSSGKYILLSFLVCLMVFSSIFSNVRNAQKPIAGLLLSFVKPPKFLIDSTIINYVMNQGNVDKTTALKELNLGELEKSMQELDGIEKVDLFMYPDGILGIEVLEQQPMFEVVEPDGLKYLVDRFGERFEKKEGVEWDLPKYLGSISERMMPDIAEVFDMLLADKFLSSETVSLKCVDSIFSIRLKSYPFEVELGNSNQLESKFSKLKIFCAFQSIKQSDFSINKINLEYKNQVVVTKDSK